MQVRSAWLKEALKMRHTTALGDAAVRHQAEIFWMLVHLLLTFSSPAKEPVTKAHITRHQRAGQRLLSHRPGGQNRLVKAAKTRFSCRCNLYLAVMFFCTF